MAYARLGINFYNLDQLGRAAGGLQKAFELRDRLSEREKLCIAIMHGMPVFRGTRVPVQTLFDYLEGGETLADFLEGFPTVPKELALQAIDEAKR